MTVPDARRVPALSLQLVNFGAAALDPAALVRVAVAADEARVDRLVAVDHVVMGSETDAYSWGRFPTGPDEPWLEPLTVLAMLAGRTSRIRLATGVLVAPLRSGALLAKTAATLDVLSGGRLDLGVGTGWQAREYEASGLDFARRGHLLDETLQTVRALWDDAPASLDLGPSRAEDVWCSPRRPDVPIWVSGSLSRAVLRRIMRFGDAWIPIMGMSNPELAVAVVELRAALLAAGRDTSAFRVEGKLSMARTEAGGLDVAATFDRASELLDAGVTDLSFRLTSLDRDEDEALRLLPGFVSAFHDRFPGLVSAGAAGRGGL
ncbi:hypothetical protein GCM10009836_24290 [Pseudonocardia ailaonensis]|uniref:Luciferase-like domain-containing protein n=1 Tax=Pseudonocardia ailaonensis TaxID=367279 RepID=A0ABN2MZ48_9PSEU